MIWLVLPEREDGDSDSSATDRALDALRLLLETELLNPRPSPAILERRVVAVGRARLALAALARSARSVPAPKPGSARHLFGGTS